MTAFGNQYMKFRGTDGNEVEGYKLHCHKDPGKNAIGYGYEGIFVGIDNPMYPEVDKMNIPCQIDVFSFNRRGKVNGFQIVQK